MSIDNLKIYVLIILMILICSGFFCSGGFDTSTPLYLLHDASAQNFNSSPPKDFEGFLIPHHSFSNPIPSDYYMPITPYISLLRSGFIDPYQLLPVEPIKLINLGAPAGMLPLTPLLPVTINGFYDYSANYMYMYIQPWPYESSYLGQISHKVKYPGQWSVSFPLDEMITFPSPSPFYF